MTHQERRRRQEGHRKGHPRQRSGRIHIRRLARFQPSRTLRPIHLHPTRRSPGGSLRVCLRKTPVQSQHIQAKHNTNFLILLNWSLRIYDPKVSRRKSLRLFSQKDKKLTERSSTFHATASFRLSLQKPLSGRLLLRKPLLREQGPERRLPDGLLHHFPRENPGRHLLFLLARPKPDRSYIILSSTNGEVNTFSDELPPVYSGAR